MSDQNDQNYNAGRELFLTALILGMMSVNSLGTCILAAFVNASWEDLGPAKKVLLFVAIITNWTGMVLAFVNRNFARLMAGKPPVNGNSGFETQQFARQDDKQQQQVLPAPKPAQ